MKQYATKRSRSALAPIRSSTTVRRAKSDDFQASLTNAKRKNNRETTTKNGESISAFWPLEVIDAIGYVKQNFAKDSFVIGIRAMYDQGVPFYRGTEDIDVYSPISVEQRNKLAKYLEKKYPRTSSTWRDFGLVIKFPTGYELDVNRSLDYMDAHYEEMKGRVVRIDEMVKVYVPPIEDLIILKLISGRKKDMRDLKHALRTGKYDKGILMEKVRYVNLEKKLINLAARVGVKLSPSNQK